MNNVKNKRQNEKEEGSKCADSIGHESVSNPYNQSPFN